MMVIDLVVMLKKDIQQLKKSRNIFFRFKAKVQKEKLLRTVNIIFHVDLTCDLLRELAILIGDFPDSTFSLTEKDSSIYIDYRPDTPTDKFTIAIRKNKISVSFLYRSNVSDKGAIINKIYTNAITPACADNKDKYTADIAVRIKNAIITELYRYIDEI